MISKELIKQFFEEQFDEISPFFLFKDHQLLSENRFEEFIERQLAKSRKRFMLGLVVSIATFLCGLAYFWFYFKTAEIANIIIAIFWFAMSMSQLFWFSKQYFIISSSMSLFQKMLPNTES